jgi:esterase/lipase superfamily enzyme
VHCMVRVFRFVLVVMIVASCSPRGQITVEPGAAQVGDVQVVFIGTTRGQGPDGLNATRSDTLGFARYDISVPPDRKRGEITWPPDSGGDDPRTQFLTTAERVFDERADFQTDLGRALYGGQQDEVVIFVHGFNTTFAEGVYRIAQMAHDLELPGVVAHYSWSSAAQPLGYVYDRDSALFARDGLERLILAVQAAGARRVVLISHSMGGALTMETLRQMAIRGDAQALSRIGGVILISPDIDVDVFHAQASAIPKLPQPFVVFTSKDDQVLKLSARLTGQTDRLGTLTKLDRVADLPITFLDTAAFASGTGHFNVGDSPSLLRLLDGILSVGASLSSDRAGRTGLLPGAVLTVQNATRIILAPVAGIGTAR